MAADGDQKYLDEAGRVVTMARGLSNSATSLETVAILFGILSLAGGLALALQTDTSGFDETHPYIVAGAVTALSGLVWALMLWTVARGLGVVGRYVALNTSDRWGLDAARKAPPGGKGRLNIDGTTSVQAYSLRPGQELAEHPYLGMAITEVNPTATQMDITMAGGHRVSFARDTWVRVK